MAWKNSCHGAFARRQYSFFQDGLAQCCWLQGETPGAPKQATLAAAPGKDSGAGTGAIDLTLGSAKPRGPCEKENITPDREMVRFLMYCFLQFRHCKST